MKKVFIFSMRVARDLVRNDFRVIDIAQNQKNKEKPVFVFKNTSKIKKFLNDEHGIKIR